VRILVATIPDRDFQEMIDSASLGHQTRKTQPNPNSHELLVARLRCLWEQRRVLFKAGVYGLVFFTIVAFLIPKRYQSTTLLMPPDDQSSSGMAMAAVLAGKMSGGLASLAGDVLGLKSSGALFIGILRSHTVEDDIINQCNLRTVYKTKSMEAARKTLSESTGIAEDRKSGIITITVIDKSPERAALIAQAYVSELNAVVNQLSTSSARRERIFLGQRLSQVKVDLENAEKDFSEFSSKNATIDIKEQGRAMVDAASTLQGQMIAAQSELEGLKQIYSDNNVRVRSLKARVAELQSQLDKLGGKTNIVNDATNPNGTVLYPSIRKLPLLGVPYADLYRKSKVEEAVYESLTQEYELAKVAEAKEIPSVKVLDPADIPEKKYSPPRLIIMLLGTFFSLALTSIWILAKARWEEIDPLAPHKLFANEVVKAAQSYMRWAPPNGSRVQAAGRAIWMRFGDKTPSEINPDK